MPVKRAWVAAVAAIAVVAVLAVVSGRSWNAVGTADISLVGWLAMGFGIVATLALGIGLMILMFYSSRHGYDEAGRGSVPPGLPTAGGRGADSEAAHGACRVRTIKSETTKRITTTA
jgi:hypothetical protein